MKRNFTACLWALLCGALAITSCDNDDDNDKTTTTLTADFTFSIGANNLVTFTNTSTGDYAASEWDFGDQTPAAATQNTTHTYPTANTYHVTLKVTASDGTTDSKQKDVVIEHDDVSGLLTPTVQKLIGGNAVGSSQVWVLDRYNQFAPAVGEALEKNIFSHLGLGEFGSYGQGWYGAGIDEKSTQAEWRIYEETFTFSLDNSGLKLVIDNPGGKGYGRLRNNISSSKFPGATAWLDPTQDNAPSAAEAEFTYTGGSYTFSTAEPETESGYAKLTLTGDAFLTYWVGTQEYEIIYLTDEVLAVRVEDLNDKDDSGNDQQIDWIFVFTHPDLLEEPEPEPEKTLAEVSYSIEGFEETLQFTLVPDNATGSGIIDNTFTEGNSSSKIYKYVKPEGDDPNWWASVNYLDAAHKFDLSSKNKIKIKVYIPSTNDYTTPSDGVAHDGIPANSPLLKQLVIKLHDSSKGGNAWQTQVEVKQDNNEAGLATNTWLDLTFDFSSVSDRTDFDKIVIQFGQEGHKRPGTFYFDDLEFFVE